MKKIAFAFFVITASFAHAALPPLAQTSREIKAILEHSELHERLGSGEVIEQILRTDTGYTIVTSHYSLEVDLVYLHSRMPGPVPFELKFHDRVNLFR